MRHSVRRRVFVATMVLMAGTVSAALAFAQGAPSATPQTRDGKAEVTALLQEFLAKVDSAAMHERFWADDLVYVSNAGVVRTKAEILNGMKPEGATPAVRGGASGAGQPSGGYSAENVVVRQFGNVVVVNFRLVQHTQDRPDTSYRNSGVFVLRGGRWQAVSWQATRVGPAS